MNIFRHSLAEDAVDRYNHTWSFMLLLVLSLVTWFLPLSPVLPPQSAASSENSHDTDFLGMPKYIAQCWCPSQFTHSQVSYSQSICDAAFNKALYGLDQEGEYHEHGANLYNLPWNRVIPDDLNLTDLRFKPLSHSKREKDVSKEKAAALSNVAHFTSFKTPLILFVFAICMKLPHIIWTILFGCVSININQTLQTAKAGQVLDKDSRRQLNQDLVHTILESAKSASFITSLLYLLFKLLMTIVAVAALIVTNHTLLPEAQNLNEIFNDHHQIQDYRNMPLMCEISISSLTNIHRYTLQCVFTVLDSPLKSDQQRLSETFREMEIMNLGIYEALYTILLALFVVLTIINVLSLLIWSAKLLLSPCRRRVSSSTNLPVDIYLLLYMALENIGHLAACDLAECFSRETGGKKKEEMQTLQVQDM